MSYFYLISAVFASAASSVFGKLYNKRHGEEKGATSLYNLLLVASFFLLWWIGYAFDYTFDKGVIWYSMLFSIGFYLYNFALIQALKYGATSLTTLFTSMSLILTTVWGFFFWAEQPDTLIIIGLAFVVLAIYFCLYSGKTDKKEFSWKWLIFSVLAMLGQATCAIVQRTQQMQFDGQHGKMLMAYASLFTLVLFIALYVVEKKSKHELIVKKSWYLPVGAGVGNMLLNLFVMLLAVSTLPPSLIYPVLGLGGLIAVALFSLFAFKEKLKWQQWLGVAFGAIATVLLSI